MLDDVSIDYVEINGPKTLLPRSSKTTIEGTLAYYIEKELKYRTPTDRKFYIQVSGLVTKNHKIDITTNILPFFRDDKKVDKLKRSITITAQYPFDKLELLFLMHLRWVLDFFGPECMYSRQLSQIVINIDDSGYNIKRV